MSLPEQFTERREELVSAWFDSIVDSYPRQTASFLRRQQDPFANPVGAGLREELAPLVDALLDGVEEERAGRALDRILRVRAVQEMPPSAAVSFVLELKQLVRAHAHSSGGLSTNQLAELDERVDCLLLLAFNVYSQCREQVYEVRVRAIHNRSLKVMERLNAWRDRRQSDGDNDPSSPKG